MKQLPLVLLLYLFFRCLLPSLYIWYAEPWFCHVPKHVFIWELVSNVKETKGRTNVRSWNISNPRLVKCNIQKAHFTYLYIYIYICTLSKENSDAMTYETSKDHSKVKSTSTHFHSNYGLQTSKKCTSLWNIKTVALKKLLQPWKCMV